MKNNWPIKKLGDSVTFSQLGLVKSKSEISDSGLPYLKMDSILSDGNLNLNKKIKVKASDSEIKNFTLKMGDFLFNTRNSPELVGKSAVFDYEENYLFNNNILRLQFSDLLPLFLDAYLHTPEGKQKLNSIKKGTTSVSAIYQSNLFSLNIPVPSINIQKKIVERLDAIRKAQELCDKQIQKTEELFESILIEIEKIKGSKVKISQICLVKGGKRIPKGLTFSSKKTNRPYLRVADFKNNSININELKFIDDLVFEKISNYTISKEDVYISIAGTTGLIGLIPNSLDGASLTENAAKLIIKNKKVISKEYLMYCLLIPSNQSSFRASTHSTSVGKLALFRIQNTNINLPTFEEQQKIVEKLEAVQNYKKLLQKEKELLKELFDSVLNKSMKGELDN